MVERYKLKARKNENNDKIVDKLKAKIVNLKNGLYIGEGQSKIFHMKFIIHIRGLFIGAGNIDCLSESS